LVLNQLKPFVKLPVVLFVQTKSSAFSNEAENKHANRQK
jgi:hypothetical protein